MRSCLYHGRVRHRRFTPAHHEFGYSIFYLYVDLDELPTLFQRHWLWSARRPNVAWFRRSDHLGDPGTSLKESVLSLVETRLGRRPAGPVSLLTQFRYFGFGFNPVSFYYCYDADGERVEAIVAEVDNTPWLEQYAYVLDARAIDENRQRQGGSWAFSMPKQFHVSPLLPMDMRYEWHFSHPSDRLNVHMENWSEDRRVFDATMVLRRRAITSGSLASALVTYPLIPLKIVGAIYFQALRLRLKGCPFHPHPDEVTITSPLR